MSVFATKTQNPTKMLIRNNELLVRFGSTHAEWRIGGILFLNHKKKNINQRKSASKPSRDQFHQRSSPIIKQ